jgi:hypothetical protein
MLHTVNGSSANLTAALNERREQYYRESGKERQDSAPNWRIYYLFGNTIYARPYYGNEHALVDISGGKTAVYILDTENLPIDPRRISWAWDFVIESGKAYLLTATGEAVVFNIDSHFLRYERTVPWREFRVPGWQGGGWIFVSDGTVTEYNISSGAVRTLGTETKTDSYFLGYYSYEDANGSRFIVGANGKAYPVLDDGYSMLEIFDRGYIYHEKNHRYKIICFFENGILTRKILLSGSAVTGDYGQESINVHGDTLYMGMKHLAFSVDLNTMQINKSFSTEIESPISGSRINIFPFGADDIVYGRYFFDGDR